MAYNVNKLTNEDRKALIQKRPEDKTATDIKLKIIIRSGEFKKK